MRRIVLAGLLAVSLTVGCSASYERRTIDGVDCVVAKSRNDNPRAISCDWNDE